jgi:hypothetical protein
VAQPSKAGAVFLFLFGMPFLGFGLFATYTFLSSSPSIHQSGNRNLWGDVCFGIRRNRRWTDVWLDLRLWPAQAG